MIRLDMRTRRANYLVDDRREVDYRSCIAHILKFSLFGHTWPLPTPIRQAATLKAFAVGNVVQQCNSSLQVPIPSASPMRFSRSQDMGNHYSKDISSYRLGDVQDSGSSAMSRIESPRRVKQVDRSALQTQMGSEWTSTNLLPSTKRRYSAPAGNSLALLFL